jgi:hypothetical protein
MTYKCIKSVKTRKNEMFHYGQEIPELLYKELQSNEKKHFVKVLKDFPQRENYINDVPLKNSTVVVDEGNVPQRFDNPFVGNPAEQNEANLDALKNANVNITPDKEI